jgi:hypothetical protein
MSSPGLPNDAEVLCYAFLVANIDWELDRLRQWADKVLSAQGAGCKQGQEWVTPDDPWWRARGTQKAAAYEPLRAAIKGTIWENTALDRIGAAMQRWQGVGRCDGLTNSDLRPQVRNRSVLGPKDSKGRAGQLRIEHAVFDVAVLIRDSLAKLRREGQSDAPPGPSMYSEIVQLKKEKKKAVADLEAARLARDRATDGWCKAKARLAVKKSAVSEARAQERAAAALKVAEARQAAKRKFDDRLEAAVVKKVAKGVVEAADRLETVTEQLKKARARARDKEWRHGESSKRLKRARLAEAEVRQLKRQVADLEASASDSDSESESDDELATVQRPRRDERGRFGAQEWRLRPMQWAQLARRTPPTAINANISDVLRVYAPDSVVPQPCKRQLQKMRGELTIAGECIAAFRVAGCTRILSFGWDESTKWGLGLLSSNMQIIEHGASKAVDLVPRGATLTAGGTAKQISKEIEEKIFMHLRKLLVGWRRCHEARFGEGSWAAAGARGGPDPECIGMHRLSERTLLQSDTCNAARATKALVAEMAEAASRDKHGISDSDWQAMDATARAAKSQARPCLSFAPPP